MVSLNGNIVTSDFLGDTYLFNISPWQIVDYDSTKVLIPDNVGQHSTTSYVEFDLYCSHIEIDYSVSSESSSYDYIQILIDGTQKVKAGGTSSTSKTTYSTDLTYGKHTIKISYRKDGSSNSGRDRCEIYAIRHTVDNLESSFLIKDGENVKTLASTITEETSLDEITSLEVLGTYPPTDDMRSKVVSKNLINKIINKKTLFENTNINLIHYYDLPKILVNQLKVNETNIVDANMVIQKDLFVFDDAKILGLSKIVIDGICDGENVLKFAVTSDELGLVWKVFNENEWQSITLEDETQIDILKESISNIGMDLSVINGLTSEQLESLFSNKKLKFAWVMKQNNENEIKIKSINLEYLS